MLREELQYKDEELKLEIPPLKLNIGCGDKILPGYMNLDYFSPKCDIRHNIFSLPWPFPDDSVEEILCSHILEHIPQGFWSCVDCKSPNCYHNNDRIFFDMFQLILEEMHRISKPNALIVCHYPHPKNNGMQLHFQHYRELSLQSFDKFTNSTTENYYSHIKFQILKCYTSDWFPIFYNKLGIINGIWTSEHIKIRLHNIHPYLSRLWCWKPSQETIILKVIK